MLKEFRDFLLRGNILELAVAFFLVVKPVNALLRRYRSPAEEGMPDEERRHQELLAALRG
jgi:large-conductance mechanosensitive channel